MQKFKRNFFRDSMLLLASILGFSLSSAFAVAPGKRAVSEIHRHSETCKGVVKNIKGETISGAAVVVKGTYNGISTGIDGEFALSKVKIGDVIAVSFLGYITEEIVWDGSDLNVVLKEDAALLDEVFVVGYGTTSKRKTTAAVSQVKAEELASVPVPNVTQSLAGRAPGLIVQQKGGGINVKSSISIRGGGTPLYVIDGVICEERDFQNINSEDIEQLSILKDASATAIYGARAANGIVMVKTKSGESGKINIDYNFNYTLSQPAYLPDKVDAYTAAYFVNRGLEYDGMMPTYTEEDLKLFKDGSDPRNHSNTDWQKECMRTFAPEQRHNLAVTGGSENMKVYTSLGYYKQESIYRTNSLNMHRYNFRTNLEANMPSSGLKVSAGVDAYVVDERWPTTSYGISSYSEVWSHIQNKRPMEPARNPDGQPFSGTTDNPLVDISNRGGFDKSRETSVRGNVVVEWDVPWVEGLKLKTAGSYSLVNDREKEWRKTAPAYDWEGNAATPNQPQLIKSKNQRENFDLQAFADYSRTFSTVHTLGVTIGMEASGNDYDNIWAGRKNYIFDIPQMSAGSSSSMENGSSEGVGERRAAVVGRVKYDYNSKYMAEFNMRHDGSDYFPKGNRWGTFFSGSLAWSISEENFYKTWGLDKALDLLKIRVSYGEIGQDNVGRYEYYTSYNLNQRGQFAGQKFIPTFSEGNLVSPDLSWYTTKDFNLGFDFAAFNNRLSGSADYFAKITTGYLTSPSNVGYTKPLGKNLPSVKSDGESIRRGFEFILSWKDDIGDFSYGVSANMTMYDDRWNINPYESEVDLKNPYKRSTQVDPYTGLYYKNLGYYVDSKDVMNSPKRNGSTNLMAGDLKYYDFNGDGKIDGDDQYRMGEGQSPKCNYGIAADVRYKGWTMNMLWQGASNYNIYMESILQGGNSNYLPVIYDFQKNVWAPDHVNGLYPRQHNNSGFNGNNNFCSTDFWLKDARYIRLKNLSIGYDFKHSLLKEASWLSKFSVSLAGYNLLTFSPAKDYGYDPETGSGSGYSYPVSRSYTINLNIGF